MKVGALYRGNQPLVARVWRADRPWTRMRGLLGRPPLQEGEGLLIVPCGLVHTIGMAYPLDLLFLDRHGCVLGWDSHVPARRFRGRFGAASTLELRAGALQGLQPLTGESLTWRAGA